MKGSEIKVGETYSVVMPGHFGGSSYGTPPVLAEALKVGVPAKVYGGTSSKNDGTLFRLLEPAPVDVGYGDGQHTALPGYELPIRNTFVRDVNQRDHDKAAERAVWRAEEAELRMLFPFDVDLEFRHGDVSISAARLIEALHAAEAGAEMI